MAIPCVLLAAGWYGFTRMTVVEEKEAPPPAKELTLKTRVQKLDVVDYPVTVETHAVVQAHNRVTLTSEVSGVALKVSPSFEVGAYFTKGELLVEIDPRDYQTALAVAKSQLASAKSALKLARLNEERKLRLIKSNAVSQAEVDVTSATREQAEADVELAATQLEQAELNLQRTRVLAPFDGRVEAKRIGVGQMAGLSAPLGEVFAIDYAEVRLPISGEQREYLDLPEFANDEPIEVTLRDAINDTNSTTWQAKIVRTEGVLDEDSRDVFAIARIDDPFGRESRAATLRIGQPVKAFIKGKVLRDVIALPRSAVREMDKVVLVKRVDQTLLPLNVPTLWADAENVIVAQDAIPQGMLLATSALPYTPEGSKVEILDEPGAKCSIADSTPADADKSVAN